MTKPFVKGYSGGSPAHPVLRMRRRGGGGRGHYKVSSRNGQTLRCDSAAGQQCVASCCIVLQASGKIQSHLDRYLISKLEF